MVIFLLYSESDKFHKIIDNQHHHSLSGVTSIRMTRQIVPLNLRNSWQVDERQKHNNHHHQTSPEPQHNIWSNKRDQLAYLKKEESTLREETKVIFIDDEKEDRLSGAGPY